MRAVRLLRSPLIWRQAHAYKRTLRDNETIHAEMAAMPPRDAAFVMCMAATYGRRLIVRRVKGNTDANA